MKKIYIAAIFAYLVLYTTHLLSPINQGIINVITLIIVGAFFVSAISLATGFNRAISIVFLGVGHGIFIYYSLSIGQWQQYMINGFNIIFLFSALPMLYVPLLTGGYLEALEIIIKQIQRFPRLKFVLMTLLFILLAIPLTIGAIPIMNRLIEKQGFSKRYLTMLNTAGYCCNMVLSPFDSMINLALVYTSITYSDYFLSAMIMSVFIIGVSTVIGVKLDNQKYVVQLENDGITKEVSKEAFIKIIQLLINIIALILLIMLGQKILPDINSIYLLGWIIAIYGFLWAIILNRGDVMSAEVINTYIKDMVSFSGFLPFLFSANFLGAMVAFTPMKDAITALMSYTSDFSLYFLLLALIGLTLVLSLIGVHMLITFTTFAYILSPNMLGISPESFVLMLMSCWFVAMSGSPFVPYASVVAKNIGDTPINVSLKYNWPFVTVMLFGAPAIILLLEQFL